MHEQPLVSIIIPTYNRAHLIWETLNSVLAQTYTNWECIVVDDGSTDATDEVLATYVEKDSRFQYHHRPKDRPKGANACRNYGFELSEGEYVNWFDSDDLMTVDHILVKVQSILKTNTSYVIAQSKFFNAGCKDQDYNYILKDINLHNYITQKVNWLTYDILIKSKLANLIEFNESLRSGQEFNYFAKLVSLSTDCLLVQQVLTLRRCHKQSIQGKVQSDKNLIRISQYLSHWHVFLDLKDTLESRTKLYLFRLIFQRLFYIKSFYKFFSYKLLKEVCNFFGLRKSFHLFMAYSINLLFQREGYFFTSKLRKL